MNFKEKVNGDQLFRHQALIWTGTHQVQSIPIPAHIAAGIMLYALCSCHPSPRRFQMSYCQVLLGSKRAFRWVFLHWSLSPPSPLYHS